MRYNGIIFDFNGVLLWDSPLHERAWQSMALALRGTPLSQRDLLERVHGVNNRHILEYLCGKPLSAETIARLSNRKEAAYRQACLAQGDQFALSPGAVPLLNWLADHDIPRTIATASEKDNVAFFIAQLRLDTWFEPGAIVYDDGALAGKPAPDMYLAAARAIGVDPAACVVVEDAATGIAAARAAGIGRIYALGPPERHAYLAARPGVYRAVTHLGELAPDRLFRDR